MKYARTTITNKDSIFNGTITTARINLNTGEIKPFNYKRATQYVKAAPKQKQPIKIDYGGEGDLLGYTPHWVKDAPNNTLSVRDGFKPKLSVDNQNNIYLTDFLTLKQAVEDISFLDNLVEGTSLLGDNKMNTRLLFNMLKDLDVIDSATIQAYTGYSLRHCQKLASHMRVLVQAFNSEVEK